MDEANFFGTAFKVDGSWYVRHQGGGGVLLPVQAPSALPLQLLDGQAYTFMGQVVHDHRGWPTSIVASDASPIGLSSRPAT